MDSLARKGHNEASFRELNEHRERTAREEHPFNTGFKVVCECSREGCSEQFSVSFRAYEKIRADARAFLVAPGHADPLCERVRESFKTYQVVEKFGEAARVTEAENPRS
jgi:hypothetical protein